MEAEEEAGRVEHLENLVQQQQRELSELRHALGDALRRLAVLERAPPPAAAHRQHARHHTAPATRWSMPAVGGVSAPTGVGSESPVSSASLSPAPSPSPRVPPSPAPPAHRAASAPLTKRWNSTGDFGERGLLASRSSAKSMLNLHARTSPNGHSMRNGDVKWEWCEAEGVLRVRGAALPIPLGEQAGAQGAQVAPPPPQRLRLEWAHGYRGRDARRTLHALPTGELAYPLANLVVLHALAERTQRHYTHHTGEVVSLAVHPNKLVVGSVQRRPGGARVWSAVSLATLATLPGGESPAALAFSRADAGRLLAVVYDAPDRTLALYDWQQPAMVADAKCSVDRVVACEFHPLERNQLVTCGKGHVAFWTLDAAGALYKRRGAFAPRDKPAYVTCVAFTSAGEMVCGDSNGALSVWGWGGAAPLRVVRGVHAGPVLALLAVRGALLSAGRDGAVHQLDDALTAPPPAASTAAASRLEPHYGGVRALAEGRNNVVYAGTTRNCILERAGAGGEWTPRVLGHCGEARALAPHPALPRYLSAAADCLLQLWDAPSRTTLWSKDIGERALCLAWAPGGDVAFVGCEGGRWLLVDTHSRQIVHHQQEGVAGITAGAYSPCGRLVACGTAEGALAVYSAHVQGQGLAQGQGQGRCARVAGAAAPHADGAIRAIEWSADSRLIRADTRSHLYHWHAETGRLVGVRGAREAAWVARGCVATCRTAAAWAELGAAAAAAHPQLGLLAAAAPAAPPHLRLYAYPAMHQKALYHSYTGHSSPIAALCWVERGPAAGGDGAAGPEPNGDPDPDGEPDPEPAVRLVSAGGEDAALLQWVLV